MLVSGRHPRVGPGNKAVVKHDEAQGLTRRFKRDLRHRVPGLRVAGVAGHHPREAETMIESGLGNKRQVKALGVGRCTVGKTFIRDHRSQIVAERGRPHPEKA